MTLDEFRISHSTLIENYQYIETHLEGIYACLSGKEFHNGLLDVERTNLNKLQLMICGLEERQGISILSDDEKKALHEVIHRRNYWVHSCYIDMVFDSKTISPKKEKDVLQLRKDLQVSEKIRKTLYEKKLQLMHNNQKENS